MWKCLPCMSKLEYIQYSIIFISFLLPVLLWCILATASCIKILFKIDFRVLQTGDVFITSFVPFLFFWRFYLFICRERGEEREKERERNISVWLSLVYPLLETWLATQACALTRKQTSDLCVCRLALNPLSHTN